LEKRSAQRINVKLVTIRNLERVDVEKDVALTASQKMEKDITSNVDGLDAQENNLSKLNAQSKRLENSIKDNVAHGDVFADVELVPMFVRNADTLVDQSEFTLERNVKELQSQTTHFKLVVVHLSKNTTDTQNYTKLENVAITKMIQS
jgi:hypothetical protein